MRKIFLLLGFCLFFVFSCGENSGVEVVLQTRSLTYKSFSLSLFSSALLGEKKWTCSDILKAPLPFLSENIASLKSDAIKETNQETDILWKEIESGSYLVVVWGISNEEPLSSLNAQGVGCSAFSIVAGEKVILPIALSAVKK